MSGNKTLLILGNGFDLDLGWKTSYADFYKSKKDDCKYYIGANKFFVEASFDCWCNLEMYLRNCAITIKTEEDAEALWYLWICWRSNLFVYLYREACKIVDEKSCAYSLLNSVKDCRIASFNYTNPFETVLNKDVDVFHVHNSLNETNAGVPKIIIGFDETAIKENPIIESNESLRVMTKSISDNNDKVDRKSHLLQLLRNSDNIVFYGLSLSITDSDYFKKFFEMLITGGLPQKNLYFVTKNPKGLEDMKKNMEVWGINYDDLVLSRNEVVCVYTDNGSDNTDFKRLLGII